jgi:hypothetical protein
MLSVADQRFSVTSPSGRGRALRPGRGLRLSAHERKTSTRPPPPGRYRVRPPPLRGRGRALRPGRGLLLSAHERKKPTRPPRPGRYRVRAPPLRGRGDERVLRGSPTLILRTMQAAGACGLPLNDRRAAPRERAGDRCCSARDPDDRQRLRECLDARLGDAGVRKV